MSRQIMPQVFWDSHGLLWPISRMQVWMWMLHGTVKICHWLQIQFKDKTFSELITMCQLTQTWQHIISFTLHGACAWKSLRRTKLLFTMFLSRAIKKHEPIFHCVHLLTLHYLLWNTSDSCFQQFVTAAQLLWILTTYCGGSILSETSAIYWKYKLLGQSRTANKR